jgi:hypothetical protein
MSDGDREYTTADEACVVACRDLELLKKIANEVRALHAAGREAERDDLLEIFGLMAARIEEAYAFVVYHDLMRRVQASN